MEWMEKIKSREARIGIIGMGYVGLPLALHFAEAGFKTTGFDIDSQKVEKVNRSESYIKHIPSARLAATKKTLDATSDMSKLVGMDAIVVCVPTPVTEEYKPNLKYLTKAIEDVRQTLHKGQLISVESSTYPGTTEEVVLPVLAQSGLRAGEDFFLIYSPEREDPGNKQYNIRSIPKVIGGITANCLAHGTVLYRSIVEKVVPVSSTRAAEATKILENVYRAVNIAMINELKMLFDRMGLDVWEIIEAAKTKPFGYHAFYPGLGPGGHCIPVDPFFLSWKAKEYDFDARFIHLAGQLNRYIPAFVLSKIKNALARNSKSLNDAKVLLLGVAYKKDIDDYRESPSLRLIELLERDGASVDYNDPYIPKLMPVRRYPNLSKASVDLTQETLSRYDCIVLATDHSDYDYGFIHEHARLVVDTRNVFPRSGKVVSA